MKNYDSDFDRNFVDDETFIRLISSGKEVIVLIIENDYYQYCFIDREKLFFCDRALVLNKIDFMTSSKLIGLIRVLSSKACSEGRCIRIKPCSDDMEITVGDNCDKLLVEFILKLFPAKDSE